MGLTLRLLFALALSAICFIAGALTARERHWFQPLVTVTLINQSDQDIKSLRLMHTTSGGKGTLEVASLRAGKSATMKFFIAGEGSYALEATLENGQVLKGGEGYVEAGYTSRHIISKTGITTQIAIGL
jgi:hypothetical protein